MVVVVADGEGGEREVGESEGRGAYGAMLLAVAGKAGLTLGLCPPVRGRGGTTQPKCGATRRGGREGGCARGPRRRTPRGVAHRA